MKVLVMGGTMFNGLALVRELRTGNVRDGSGLFAIDIPRGAVAGTTRGRVRLFRGAADQALDGLEGMLREPYGCFEQTSSTTYPNILVLDYLKRSEKARPEIEAKALKLIQAGWQRLVTFEVTGGGFSWFGRPPANQILTAYGLMEFHDMAQVFEVDPSAAVLAVEKQVSDFEMPGTGIPGFSDHARRIADAGIYDFAIHHDKILQPVVLRDWAVESLEGLSGEAEEARERLIRTIERIGRIGHRMADRRDARKAAEREPVGV